MRSTTNATLTTPFRATNPPRSSVPPRDTHGSEHDVGRGDLPRPPQQPTSEVFRLRGRAHGKPDERLGGRSPWPQERRAPEPLAALVAERWSRFGEDGGFGEEEGGEVRSEGYHLGDGYGNSMEFYNELDVGGRFMGVVAWIEIGLRVVPSGM